MVILGHPEVRQHIVWRGVKEKTMKIICENLFELTEKHNGIPIIIEDVPIGVITEVTTDTFVVQLWEKYIGLEIQDFNLSKITAIHLSKQDHYSFQEIKKMISKRNSDEI